MKSSARTWPLVLAAAGIVHVVLVADIVRQPLNADHRRSPLPAERAVVWPLFFDSVNAPGPGADFFAVYHAGVQVARGESPYARVERPPATPYFFIYRYPPVVAHTLGRLAASMPPRSAYVAWALVVELTLAALLAAVWRQRLRAPYCWIAPTLLLLSTPYLLELHMGQFTFFASALTALALMAVQSHPARAALGLAAALPLTMAAALKQFPLMVAPALVRSRAGRAAAVVLIVSSALLLTPVLLDDRTRDEFVRLNLLDDTSGLYPGNFAFMYQVFATAMFLNVPVAPTVWGNVVGAAGLALFGLIAFLAWRSGAADDARRTGGVLMAAFFLTYFRVWEHHFSAVVVAGTLVLLSVAADSDRRAPARRQLVATGMVLLAAPTLFLVLPRDPASWSASHHYLLAWPKIAGTCAIVAAGLQAPAAASTAAVRDG